MMKYELSFISDEPWRYATQKRKHRRVLRDTREQIIDLADEICLTQGFDLLAHLSLLLSECDGVWKDVYEIPDVYINMFLRRYKMHICYIHVLPEDCV